MHFSHGVVGGQCFEFVRSSAERQVRELRDRFSDFLGESDARVKTGADGCASSGQVVKSWKSCFDSLNSELELTSISSEFLTYGMRSPSAQISTMLTNSKLGAGYKVPSWNSGQVVGETYPR